MPHQFSAKPRVNTNESLTACGLDCNTLSFLEIELRLPYEQIYGTFLFYKCGDYKIVSEFMSMRDPNSGWRGRQHAMDLIKEVSAKMNDLMYKTWITVRKEWLETCRGITGGTMDEALLFAMDSEPIPCDDIPDTYNTKYAECILKLNATILLNGFIVHGGKIWVGTVTAINL